MGKRMTRWSMILVFCIWMILPVYASGIGADEDFPEEVMEEVDLMEEAGLAEEAGLPEEEAEVSSFNPYVFSVSGEGETASVVLQPELMDLENGEEEGFSDLIMEETQESLPMADDEITMGNSTAVIAMPEAPFVSSLDYNVSTTLLTTVVNVPLGGFSEEELKGILIEGGVVDRVVGTTNFSGILGPDRFSTSKVEGENAVIVTAAEKLGYDPSELEPDTLITLFLPNPPHAGDIINVQVSTFFQNEMTNHTSSRSDLVSCTVEPAGLGEDTVVTLTPDTFVFSGGECTPAVSVVTAQGVALTENTDYTVAFADNVNAGTASVVVTGIGDYTGSVTKTFTITPASGDTQDPGNTPAPAAKTPGTIQAADVTVSASKKDFSFSLGASTDAGQLSYASSIAGVSVDANGTVTVKKNFIGEALITVAAAETPERSGAGRIVTVTVTPPKPAVAGVKSSGAGKAKVKWKKAKVKGVTGWQISASTKKDFSANVKNYNAKGKKTAAVISKLKPGKTYYIRMRLFKKIGGKTFYSPWSKIRKVKIRK